MNTIYIKLNLLFLLLFTLINTSSAVDPAFELSITNGTYTSSNEGYFDVVIKHTNYPASEFLYVAGQYYIDMDSSIGSNFVFTKDTSTSNANYENKIPNEFIGGFSRIGYTLRLTSITIPPGFEPVISHTTGTLVLRIKFVNTDLYGSSCILNYDNFNFRIAPPNNFTKIFARINGELTELQNNENVFISYLCDSFQFCCIGVPPVPPVRMYPPDNSIGVPSPFTFTWRRGQPVFPPIVYRIQISEDASFDSVTVDNTFGTFDDTVVFLTNALNFNTVYHWRVRKGSSGGNMGAFNEPWKFSTEPIVLCDLKLIPEGYFTLQTHPSFGVKAYLRNIGSPFAIVDSASSVISDFSWSNIFNFTNAPTEHYYIVVKHFNTIETWSKSGGSLLAVGDTNVYDFSASASQAFGNNLKQVGTTYCLYSGDVNQNGFVDGADILIINNDAANFVTGYMPSDINGDGFCDLTDLLIAYDNSVNFVHLIRP